MPDLVGSFFLADTGEHYRTGEILTEISVSTILCASTASPPPSRYRRWSWSAHLR